jgi:hypothetical protein
MLGTFLVTMRRRQASQRTREETPQMTELRRTVHRTMMGSKRRRISRRRRVSRWASGKQGSITRMNVIPNTE